MYDLYEPIDAGNASIKLLYSTAYGEDSSSNAIFLKMDDVYCTYLSSGILELDEELTFGVRNYMTVSDSHIYGVHGKKYKKKHFMTAKEYSLDNIILNKVYLTPELLEEYEKDGCEIIANPSKVELYRN